MKSSLLSTQLPTAGVLLQHIIFWSLVLMPHTSCFMDKKFEEQVYQLQNVNNDQIRRWWFRAQAEYRDFPRVFPFCFDTKLKVPDNVTKAVSLMKAYAAVRDYDPEVYGWGGRAHTHFESMYFNRIQIERAKPKPDVFSGVEGKKPYVLHQWVDFAVKFRKDIKWFYVQAIGGPLGLPTGEFTKEFQCTHGDADEAKYLEHTSLEPCHFAPRSAFTWPNVFTWFGNKAQSKIKFRYRWTESHCHETAFFQFIMIAISMDGNTPHVILSPMFRYVKMDSASGVTSPYHPYYDKITCGLSHEYNSNLVVVDSGLRIIPNKDYDECVLKGTQRGNRNSPLERDTCPPGPFECSQFWNSAQDWKNKMDEWWDKTIQKPEVDCCQLFPLILPATTATTTTTTEDPNRDNREPKTTGESALVRHQKEQERILTAKSRKFQLKHQITHGDICVLVWLVFVPTADTVVRFFKDFSDIKSLGLGFWIIAHVLLHSVGLMMVWWSFGLVVGVRDDTLGELAGVHFAMGIICTLLQHAQFVTGLKRTSKERERFNYVLVHSMCGYFSHAAGYLSVIFSSAGTARKLSNVGIFLIWLLSTVAFAIVERHQDKILGVVLHRAQWPVLQRIVIDEGSPPLRKAKIWILLFLVIGQCSIFSYTLIIHSAETTALLKSANGTMNSQTSKFPLTF